MLVDEGRTCSAAKHTDGQGNEHETGDTCAVTLSFLENDRVAVASSVRERGESDIGRYSRDEEHVEQPVQH